MDLSVSYYSQVVLLLCCKTGWFCEYLEIIINDTYLTLGWGQRLVIVCTEFVLLSVCVDLLKPPQHTEIPEKVVLGSTLTTGSTYRPFLVLDGRNFVFDFAVVSLVVAPSNPSLWTVFVEHASGVCEKTFGGSGTGGTTTTFTFSAAEANKPLKSRMNQ